MPKVLPLRLTVSLRLLVGLLVLAIALPTALSGYLSGWWTWANLPPVPHLKTLQTLQAEGLALPGWQTLGQAVTRISGHRWSVQTLQPERSPVPTAPVLLLLRPQMDPRDQPQVEWIDIAGEFRWTVDSVQTLPLTSETTAAQPATVWVQLARGWNRQQTYAVVQWYAWTGGGSPKPFAWFWSDQLTQWHNHQRTPWVAIAILIPIPPLADIHSVRPLSLSLAQTVQSALMMGPFSSSQ